MMTNNQKKPLDTLVLHWIWEMLYTLDGSKEFLGEHGFDKQSVAKAIGADKWFEGEDDYQPAAARRKLREHYEKWQETHDFQQLWPSALPEVFRNNLAGWESIFGLNDVEIKIWGFMLLLRARTDLAGVSTMLGELDDEAACRTLAVLLKEDEQAVNDALSLKGRLKTIGLLSLDRNDTYSLRSKIDLISNSIAPRMLTEPTHPIDVLAEFVSNAPQTRLGLDDFRHLGDLAQAAVAYLCQVFALRSAGCNILLYGAAGTGKTEFARVLAQAAGVELYETAWSDEENRPTDRRRRMNALRMAQNLFDGQNTLLMFDEAEDLFDPRQEDFALNKAWLNRMLETNPVPTVWVCNEVGLLDASAVRRFDMVIEMKSPPASVRSEMIRRTANGALPENRIRILAQQEILVPALLDKAHKVLNHIGGSFDTAQQGALYETLLGNTLKAQGYAGRFNRRAPLPEHYNPKWINCTQDLAALADGLVKSGRGTLCLYGASGTGKSAFAAWLAQQADRPLLYKRASDLLSKYVGESEQQIAAAFDEARESGAVLVFDEVDTFLQDRRGAHRSWEISQVNEMLTQMEDFDGIFVASTNLMKHLDQAVLRRFDFKIEFGYLKPEQVREVFDAYCTSLGLMPSAAAYAELARLPQLALGDFALAVRQAKIVPFADAAAFADCIKRECLLKEGVKSMAGFV